MTRFLEVIRFLALGYLGLCFVLILSLIVGTLVTDIRWRLRQRKRERIGIERHLCGLPSIDPRSRPQP